jgi:hypothetical protein
MVNGRLHTIIIRNFKMVGNDTLCSAVNKKGNQSGKCDYKEILFVLRRDLNRMDAINHR